MKTVSLSIPMETRLLHAEPRESEESLLGLIGTYGMVGPGNVCTIAAEGMA